MTIDELRALYTEAHNLISKERRMREYVFRAKPATRDAKMAEMTRLLDIVTAMKDELKPHVDGGYEQPPLLDVARPAKYE